MKLTWASFKRLSKDLGVALDERGFTQTPGRELQLDDKWNAFYSSVGKFTGLPRVTIYYGNYLSEGQQIYVGFESTRPKPIETLVSALKKANAYPIWEYDESELPHPSFRPYVRKQVLTAYERDPSGYTWIGLYFLDGGLTTAQFVASAKDFLRTVIQAVGASSKQVAPKWGDDRKVMRAVMERRGQPQFRNMLMRSYDGSCAISGCSVPDLLEAAHLKPHSKKGSYEVRNGLLLRADLHTLLDCGSLKINPRTRVISIANHIVDPQYRAFHGKRLRNPTLKKDRPTFDSLTYVSPA